MTDQLLALLSALGLVLGLIVAIGGQNAFLLRQGVRKEHVGVVVLIFAVSDAILQTAGVLGVSTLVERLPLLEPIARWAGASFLVGYAFISARRALRGGGGGLQAAPEDADQLGEGGGGAVATKSRAGTASLRRIAIGAIAVTWLNPHALVETTIVIGSVSTPFAEHGLWFLAGGILASTLWFVCFGYGARLLAPLLRTERSWRILDGAIAVIMLGIACALVLG